MQGLMIEKARQYLESGRADRVLAWEQGENGWDRVPAVLDAATTSTRCATTASAAQT